MIKKDKTVPCYSGLDPILKRAILNDDIRNIVRDVARTESFYNIIRERSRSRLLAMRKRLKNENLKHVYKQYHPRG